MIASTLQVGGGAFVIARDAALGEFRDGNLAASTTIAARSLVHLAALLC